LIVIVTVITDAEVGDDGTAHFQTFVDVTGDAAPTENQKKAICEGIKKSLSTRLNVDSRLVQCALSERTTTKRATSSYVADLTVGSSSNVQGNSASALVASFGLVAAAVIAAI